MKKENEKIFFVGAAIAAVLLLSYNNTSTQKDNVPTATKRDAIIVWWEVNTSAMQQAADNGRFEDVIKNISSAEIDIVYNYVFNYLDKSLEPPAGSIIAQQIEAIKKAYNIFQS